MHPAIYAQLAVHSILDEGEDMCCAEDIPLNAATVDIISLIEEVSLIELSRAHAHIH